MKVQRSLPYFNTLLKSPTTKRMDILQAFPSFVIDDLVEVLYNVVLGRIDIGTKKRNLNRHKRVLIDLVTIKGKKARRNKILEQKGGFIGALLPLVLSILGGTML